MKKSVVFASLFIFFLVGIFFVGFASAFAGGDGTLGNPYQITNWTDLNATRDNLTAYYILMNNLSAMDGDYISNWMPIGTDVNPFSGSFNGNGKTISNLTINLPSTNYVGLFGYVAGNISNVNLNVDNISGGLFCGGLVGAHSPPGIISNVSVIIYGSVSGELDVGGLVGSSFGEIFNSYATILGTVSASDANAGGLAGFSGGGSEQMSSCYATILGTVSAINANAGGLVGSCGFIMPSPCHLSNSSVIISASGKINSSGYIGLMGYKGSGASIIASTYATVYDSQFGNITFLDWNVGKADGGNLLDYIYINNNSVTVDSTTCSGCNVSANITLTGISTNRANYRILKDGTNVCNATTSPACFNFTSLDAGTVIFNVSSWSNYTIASDEKVYPIFSNYYDNNATLIVNGTGLFNITLTNTNGTVWLEINNTNITATNLTANVYNVSYNFITNGTYSYRWHAYGNGSVVFINNSALRSYTVLADTSSPILVLNSPANGYSSTPQTISFSFNVSDSSNIANCSLIINNAIDQTNSTIGSSRSNIAFSKTLVAGSYSWSINCTDIYGNSGNSSSRTLTLASDISEDTGGNGGGSGTSSNTQVLSDEQFKEGFSKRLAQGDRFKFKFENETHYVILNSLTNTIAKIEVNSVPQYFSLSNLEYKKVNLNSDNYYDLFVYVNSISNNKANITIKYLHELIPVSDSTIDGASILLNDSCKNGIKDSTESDIDCGGDCSPCKDKLDLNGLFLILGIILAIIVLVIFVVLRLFSAYRIRPSRFFSKSRIYKH